MMVIHCSYVLPHQLSSILLGIEGGFDVEQEQYEEEVKVVLFPDRQEVTSDDLTSMPDVVKERVRQQYSGSTANLCVCVICSTILHCWNGNAKLHCSNVRMLVEAV